jgi:hypothetical protein
MKNTGPTLSTTYETARVSIPTLLYFFFSYLYKSSTMSLTNNSLCDTHSRVSEGGANATRHED